MGQCENCKMWNTLVEKEGGLISRNVKGKKASKDVKIIPVKLDNITATKRKDIIKTNISEFDNALGGRLIKGQVILFSGEPGIGKSTLTLQIIEELSNQGLNILYIAGEESPYQIKDRADRLKLKLKNVEFVSENNVNALETYISSHSNDIDFLVVDSIQTLYSPDLNSSSGSVSQVAEGSNRLTSLAKGLDITTILIGHVTKSGDIAGPKIIEHMVDTVLYLEGEKRLELRILKVEKNRFGPSDEAGLFKMEQDGLKSISDTKELFTQSSVNASGSCYTIALEGTRSVAIEIQALATKTYFSNPRRATSGFDLNRLFILIAIIEKRLKIKVWEYDVFVNVTGGIRINDPAIDLAIITSIISSIKDIPIPKENVYFGEVGLTGEIRKVFMQDKRIKEGKRLGFTNITSSINTKNINSLKV